MCGRFTQKQKAAIIEKMYGVEKVVAEISASFNVCPGQDVAAMPVILPPSAIDAWLDPEYREASRLLQPYPDDAMAWYPVSDAVNSHRNDGPELIRPLAG